MRLKRLRTVCLGLAQDWSDQIGKFHEESLALLGALTLVSESKRLVGAAAQLDKVELVVFEDLAELLGLFWVESLVLKFNRVQLDTEDEV